MHVRQRSCPKEEDAVASLPCMHPEEAEPGREGADAGRPEGRSASSNHPTPGGSDNADTKKEARTFLTHTFGRGLADKRYGGRNPEHRRRIARDRSSKCRCERREAGLCTRFGGLRSLR